MSKDWGIKNFVNCLEKIVYTTKIKCKNFLDIGEFPIISQEQDHINGYWNNSNDLFRIKKPVVIFGDHTKVLKFVDFDFVLGADGVKILQPINEIEPRYFYYYLQNVNLGDLGYARHYRLLKKIKIHYPKSLPEQKRIVSILDKGFAAIDKAVANTEKNLQNAKELFDSYLNEIFSNPGDDWERKKLGAIADAEYGFTAKAKSTGEYRYVRITDIDVNGSLTHNSKKYVNHSTEITKYVLKNNDLLMARTGATFAKVLLYKDIEPSIFASYLIKITFHEKNVNELYWFFSKTRYYWVQAEELSSGTAQPHFNGKALKQVFFPYPKSLDEQKLLITKFRNLYADTKRLESIYQQKLDNLKELKQSILHKAFEGEL
ncbi:MAG: restriction endonuclease subunit S [Candidatus Celaenobacter antarcticus]|nr:restriction endonuclease subunit S [Candidatus Celaenobacter antarcticus]